MKNPPGKTLLLASAISLISVDVLVAGLLSLALLLGGTIFALSGNSPNFDQGAVGVLKYLLIFLFISLLDIAVGIAGIIHAAKPQKAALCTALGIGSIVWRVFPAVVFLRWFSFGNIITPLVIYFIPPVLYLIGACKNKKAADSGWQPVLPGPNGPYGPNPYGGPNGPSGGPYPKP